MDRAISRMPDDYELEPCEECGHLHWNGWTEEYEDCPVCDCRGQE